MGIYREHVLPRIVNASCGIQEIEPFRERACSGLAGHVVEVGFGSGLNVPFYPGGVASIAAVEPSSLAWKMATERVASSHVDIVQSGLDGQRLPFDDNSFDSALSTFTLCTIPDVSAALAEIRRVLKPGGTFHFLEHGLAPDADVQRWQQRINPVQKFLCGGCHVNRPIDVLVRDAGFDIADLDRFYVEKAPKFSGAGYLGMARQT